jgi:signal transduction histidine kinase
MDRAGQNQWSSQEVARLLALVESDRRFYQQILAILPIPLAVLGEDRTVIASNRAFRSLLGQTKESLSGERIEQLFPAYSGSDLIERMRDLHAHGTPSTEFPLEVGGRQHRASLITLGESSDDDSRQTLLVIQGHAAGTGESAPISTPSSKQEAPLNEPSALLERRQLIATRSEALQGMAAKLAHDLNNPLMIITGYAEEMLGGIPADNPHRAEAEQILVATERISSITAQLLEFTRKRAKPPQGVDVAEVLSAVQPQIAQALGNRVQVEVAPASALWAMADTEQLKEVLLTLASADREGARERTKLRIMSAAAALSSGITVTDSRLGRFACIALHDDGTGFDAEQSLGVFESILSKEKGRTPGQALASAYRIVREWGGDIVYTGEPSIGTSFLVYLPLAEAVESPATKPTLIIRKSSGTQPTVLVVDDEPDIRSLVAKILRRQDYNVLEAGSVKEGLAVASAHHGSLDLLVSDVMLPDRSGRELAEQLRESLPTLKVLYISGYTDDESVRSGARPAGAKFLQKPFTLGALLGKVREALQ